MTVAALAHSGPTAEEVLLCQRPASQTLRDVCGLRTCVGQRDKGDVNVFPGGTPEAARGVAARAMSRAGAARRSGLLISRRGPHAGAWLWGRHTDPAVMLA